MTKSRRWLLSVVALALAATSLLCPVPGRAQDSKPAGLAISEDIKALPGVAFDAAIAAKLPARIKSAGVLTVATDALTPPITFLAADNAGIIGIDADLAQALGIVFGVKVAMTDVGAGAAIVPGIKSARFDMSISGINDDPLLEQQLDVMDYMFDATTIMVQKGNPLGIAAMSDLCGHKVALPVGTFQERMVLSFSAKCAKPIEIVSIPRMPDVLAAVRAGRADATVNGYATSVYTTEHQIQKGVGLQALPGIRLAVGYLGMLTRKDDPALRDAVQAAMRHIIDSGAYLAIMKKWGLEALAVKAAKVNDAASMPVDN